MKVGVEGIPLFGERTGVGQYTKRILEAASEKESGIKFEIIRQLMPHRRINDLPIKPNKNLAYRVVRWMPPIIYYQLFKRTGRTLPYDVAVLRRYDLMLYFNFVAYPVTKRTKTIVVIHDLTYVNSPEYVSPKNRGFLIKFVPKSLKNADHIIAVSENTKREIVDYYKVKPQKISVITPAVSHEQFYPRPQEEIKKINGKFGIDKEYILSVSTIEPRKNLVGVFEAFEMLPEKLKQKYALVLVGGQGWLDSEIQRRYENLAQRYTVIKTGYVDDNDLPAIYSGASVFVYPSFYEGFGIPALEAMACGTPVITSDNTSLPEVVGNAAIKIKASDTRKLSRKLEYVLTDKNLANNLSTKGLAQAKKFSWDKSADMLIELIEKASK